MTFWKPNFLCSTPSILQGEERRGGERAEFHSPSLKSMRNWWFCCFWLLEGTGSFISDLLLEAPGCKSEQETDDVSLLVVEQEVINFKQEEQRAQCFWPMASQRQISALLTSASESWGKLVCLCWPGAAHQQPGTWLLCCYHHLWFL